MEKNKNIFDKIKMNKKGLEMKSAFFALTVISIAIVAAVGIHLFEWNREYGAGLENEFPQLAEFNKLDELSLTAAGFKNQSSTSDPSPGTDSESNTFRAAYGIITNIFSQFSIIFGNKQNPGLLASLGDKFGLPNYLLEGLFILMTLAIVFWIIAVIFRLGGKV